MYLRSTCLVYFLNMSRVKTKMKKLLIFYSNLSHISVCLKDMLFSSSVVSIVIEAIFLAKALSDSYLARSSGRGIQPSSWAFYLVPILICLRSPERYILGSFMMYFSYWIKAKVQTQRLRHSQNGGDEALPWVGTEEEDRADYSSWNQGGGLSVLTNTKNTVVKVFRSLSPGGLLELRELLLCLLVELGETPVFGSVVDVKVHNLNQIKLSAIRVHKRVRRDWDYFNWNWDDKADHLISSLQFGHIF